MHESVFSMTADEAHHGKRVDAVLALEMEEQSRSSVQKLIAEGFVTINGKPAAKNAKLKMGDIVSATVPPPKTLDVIPQDLPLSIVYEDDALLVVNKPKGMVVHPAAGNPDHTLVNALLFHCGDSLSGINGVIRPGIVHRIDKDTSGLLIVAKTDEAHRGLAEQIQVHSFLREYEAVVYGRVKEDDFTIDLPIGRSKVDRQKMCVTYENSKPAITHVHVIRRYDRFTHIRCRLETGRTHQIRVHLSYMGYPLAGDARYGPKKVIEKLHGQCLHAKTIGFVHPVSNEYLFFDSPLPDYFTAFLAGLSQGEEAAYGGD